MSTPTSPAALIPVVPVFTNTERLALAGSLAGYGGLTHQAYELDLRQYVSWCHQHHLRLFRARRADIECFARDLEIRGRARATITRRLCTIAGFYRTGTLSDSTVSYSFRPSGLPCSGCYATLAKALPPPIVSTATAADFVRGF